MAAAKKVFSPPITPTTLPLSRILRRAKNAVSEKFDACNQIGALLKQDPSQHSIVAEQFVAIYAAGSLRVRKPMTQIEEGAKRIISAYDFSNYEFERLGRERPEKKFRKDGKTPMVIHSLRVALIGAYLGAGSHQIASLLLHDCPEDCGTSIYDIKNRISKRTAIFVSLFTKPKLHIEQGARGVDKVDWVFLLNDLAFGAKEWERTKDCAGPEHYEGRLRTHMTWILNTRVGLATPEIKLKAHLYKLVADGLDNFVTDIHLDPTKARIRCAALVPEIRHLEITGPTIRKFFIELLMERGFDISDAKTPRIVPEQKVIECLPIDKHLNVSVLDRLPAPNGHIIIYVDEEMKSAMRHRNYKGRIRIELPHSASIDSHSMLLNFFSQNYPSLPLRAEPGESLLPWASEAAGRHVFLRGVNSLERYQLLITALESFHDFLSQH